jgi:hypothetical protein
MFTIEADSRLNLLRVRVIGFLSLEQVAELARAQDSAARGLPCPPNEHLMLCDTSACVLQSQSVVAEFGRLIDFAPRRARRLAVVTGNAASRMQVRRILKRANAEVFVSREDGEAWLLGPEGAEGVVAEFAR